MLQPKKTLKNTPVMKLERKLSYQMPKSMPTKPASEVSSPKREFISKLNAAAEKAKESKGYNVPFGGGSNGSKKGDMKSSSSYKNTNK